jgi:hypothetical protein
MIVKAGGTRVYHWDFKWSTHLKGMQIERLANLAL